MWLEKLNPDIVQILAALTDEVGIEKLAAIADKILDTRPTHHIASVVLSNDSLPNTNQQLQTLASESRKLSLRLDDIQNTPSRSRSNSATRHSIQRRRSTSRSPDTINVVFAGTTRCSVRAQKDSNRRVHTKARSQPSNRETTSLATIKGLFYIHDRNSNLKFLIDTGAQISVIPVSNCSKSVTTPKEALLKLQAANGTPISTYDECIMSFNIGLRREFTWTFKIADVETPILGADFLAHFNLSVELSSRTLTDTRTSIQRRGALSRHSTIVLTALIPGTNGYENLF
ncbi:unnamed protein product [Acanthosepion pharaonis]|uniref:Peptidase A2 domain-containing protein n=1 Tax=Acanthosepion pharaonis TaxID=158019 RepID=A0A812DFJ5_ACAPH|nr:unnamed protein product [Sepia pharaonis]